MRFALLGYGGMGQSAARALRERKHTVSAIIDKSNPEANFQDIDSKSLANADVVIDFTQPAAVLSNLESVLALNVPLVIGTTGWYASLAKVKELSLKAKGKVLWSSNFSVGVNLYFKIVEAAAKLVNAYPEYDVWGTELHHNRKSDSPSGTAKTLEKILLQNITRKTSVVEDKLDRAIEPQEIHFSSTRGGAVNFSHTIGFDSAADAITVTHSARNRDGYALGAVQAAEWLVKQKPGFYSMEDFLSM